MRHGNGLNKAAIVSLASVSGELGRVAVALAFRKPPDPALGDVSSGLPESPNPTLGEALRWLWQRPFTKQRGEGYPSPKRATVDWAGQIGRERSCHQTWLACVVPWTSYVKRGRKGGERRVETKGKNRRKRWSVGRRDVGESLNKGWEGSGMETRQEVTKSLSLLLCHPNASNRLSS